MKSAPAISFDYRPSRWPPAVIAAIALLAVVSIGLSGLSLAYQVLLILLTAVYATIMLRRSARSDYVRIVWHAQGNWRVTDRHDHQHDAQLRHATVIGGAIVMVLRVMPDLTLSVLLLSDNSSPETQRLLRVRLSRHRTMAANGAANS